MKIQRLNVGDHDLLKYVSNVLGTIHMPPPPTIHRGDFWKDIEDGPPNEDRPRPHNYYRQVVHPPAPLELPGDTVLSSIVYYPPRGAGLGWHTDSRAPGWRVYISWLLGSKPGTFLTLGDGSDEIYKRIRRTDDEAGIATAFFISGKPGDSWHAVEAPDERLSIGIRIYGYRSATARALGLVA